MNKKIAIITYVFLCSFSFSYASIKITEVMYNPEGVDTNREWVEIYNNSSSAVDVSSWYFYEGETYHGMHPDNFSNLDSGQRALIVKDISAAKSELGSSLRYIKSSFSLNNTGETITIANTEKNHVDSYSYSVDDGANGEGDSLQVAGSSWYAASPTPGKENILNSLGDDSENNNSDLAHNNETKKYIVSVEPYYIPSLKIPSVIVAQADFQIKANVDHVRENKKTQKLKGYFYINLGNGKSIDSGERIDQVYRYRNAGDYIVVFEYYSSYLAFENGDDPDALLKRTIHVNKHDLEIIKVDHFNGVVLKNNTSKVIDLSSWNIIWRNESYSFPRHSFLVAQNKTSIQFHTLGFSPKPSNLHPVQLLSNAYKPVSSFSSISKNNISAKKKSTSRAVSISNQKPLIKKDNINLLDVNENLDFFGNHNSYLEDYLYENPNKLKVDFGEGDSMLGIHSKRERHQEEKTQNIYYVLVSMILMLSAARVLRYRKINKETKKSKNLGTIELIE